MKEKKKKEKDTDEEKDKSYELAKRIEYLTTGRIMEQSVGLKPSFNREIIFMKGLLHMEDSEKIADELKQASKKGGSDFLKALEDIKSKTNDGKFKKEIDALITHEIRVQVAAYTIEDFFRLDHKSKREMLVKGLEEVSEESLTKLIEDSTNDKNTYLTELKKIMKEIKYDEFTKTIEPLIKEREFKSLKRQHKN